MLVKIYLYGIHLLSYIHVHSHCAYRKKRGIFSNPIFIFCWSCLRGGGVAHTTGSLVGGDWRYQCGVGVTRITNDPHTGCFKHQIRLNTGCPQLKKNYSNIQKRTKNILLRKCSKLYSR
jgi:hypothetical protein